MQAEDDNSSKDMDALRAAVAAAILRTEREAAEAHEAVTRTEGGQQNQEDPLVSETERQSDAIRRAITFLQSMGILERYMLRDWLRDWLRDCLQGDTRRTTDGEAASSQRPQRHMRLTY